MSWLKKEVGCVIVGRMWYDKNVECVLTQVPRLVKEKSSSKRNEESESESCGK